MKHEPVVAVAALKGDVGKRTGTLHLLVEEPLMKLEGR